MIGALLAAALAHALAGSGAPTPRFPKGTAPMQLAAPSHGGDRWDAAQCATCHEREAAAWSLSGHAQARGWLFQAAVQREDPAWCVRCHAPQATSISRAEPPADAPAEEHGVTCAACHAESGLPLRSPLLCAGCHQFGFAVRDDGGRFVKLAREPQQNTLGEWQEWSRSARDGRTCADCHVPGGDHSFGGARRAERLASAVEVAAAGRMLTVALKDVGHRLPTGDVMRWISVEAASDALFESPVTLATFRRELGMRRRGPEPFPYLGVVRDTTLAPGAPAIVVVPATGPGGTPLTAWRVVYHLVSEEQESQDMIPPGLSRIVLHGGLVTEEGS